MAKTTHLSPVINLNRMHTKTRPFPFLYLERVGRILYNHVRVLHIYYYFIANRYSLRLEAMLQKEEFQITLDTIEPSIEALKGAMEG